MERPKKISMGTCPKCGSHNVEYYDMDMEDELLIHKCECYDCQLVFREYEKTIYDGYSFIDDEGNLHDCDADGREP